MLSKTCGLALTLAFLAGFLGSPDAVACIIGVQEGTVGDVDLPGVEQNDNLLIVRDPTESKGGKNAIEFEITVVSDLATQNPNAAIALMLMHPEYATEATNILKGQVAIPGVATPRTVELMLSRADDHHIAESMGSLEEGTFVDVRWTATDIDSDSLRVTIESEVADIETLVGKGLTHPRTYLLVRKVPPQLLRVWHE